LLSNVIQQNWSWQAELEKRYKPCVNNPSTGLLLLN